MNEFDLQISDSLKRTIHEFIEREKHRRQVLQSISSHEHSITWIKKELLTKKLSQANITEYNHQIRYHELNLSFLYDE